MKKIKVCYLYDFKDGQDYMNDAVYHGLIDSGMFDVYEYGYPYYMLKSCPNIDSLYGRGFTMFGKLNHTPNVEDPNVMSERIRSKFYDIIIYGCAYKGEHPFKELVSLTYPKNKIHVIDGCDWTGNFAYNNGLEFGTVWKTSLDSMNYGNPIQFAIPESQLIDHKPTKEKMFSLYDPRSAAHYMYENENDYYNDYATSYYGVVTPRAQWNTMRVLEILANRCVPYFIDIEKMPNTVMKKFPREIILETNKYAVNQEIHPRYDEISEELFQFTKNNLTTKELVKIFLI